MQGKRVSSPTDRTARDREFRASFLSGEDDLRPPKTESVNPVENKHRGDYPACMEGFQQMKQAAYNPDTN